MMQVRMLRIVRRGWTVFFTWVRISKPCSLCTWRCGLHPTQRILRNAHRWCLYSSTYVQVTIKVVVWHAGDKNAATYGGGNSFLLFTMFLCSKGWCGEKGVPLEAPDGNASYVMCTRKSLWQNMPHPTLCSMLLCVVYTIKVVLTFYAIERERSIRSNIYVAYRHISLSEEASHRG